MESSDAVMVLGVGSSHGDDSIGWRVIDEVDPKVAPPIQLRKLASPIEMIDYLTAAPKVHVIDAARGIDQQQQVERWPCIKFLQCEASQATTLGGTHGISVGQTIRLAETLGLPTDHVAIWLVRGETFDSLTAPSQLAIEATRQCAQQIVQELHHA